MQPISTQSPLIKRARQEAVFLASSVMDRCVEAARVSLTDAERNARSVALRMELSDALAALLQCRSQLRTNFPANLDHAFLAALDDARAEAGLPAVERDEQDELTLVEEAEISRFVESSRLQQAVMPVVEHALTRLDSLMSSALGLPMVRAELNPLRPDVVCRVLQEVIAQTPEPPETQSHWVRHFARPFAQELNHLYASVADMLENQGVEEARYRLKLTESGAAPAAPNAAPESGGDANWGNSDAGWGDAGQPLPAAGAPPDSSYGELFPTMYQLAQPQSAVPPAVMRDFLYRPQWIQAHDEPLSAAYYESARAQAAAVTAAPVDQYNEKAEAQARARERALSVVDRPPRKVEIEAQLSPQHWGEQASAQARTRTLLDLKTKASKVSQVLGLDAVRTLVSQVAGDQRVLAPVREAFVALEPTLLRMAMDDPRFFGDDRHPARRLIEEIAQRSFKYNDEFAEDFEHFMEPVRQMVRELNATAKPEQQDFTSRLQALQTQWKVLDADEKLASAPGMQSVQFAQERQALADKVAWEFGLRSDLEGVPGKVADFLFQDWSLVIAQAQLTAERSQLDPGGYLAVVSDLLWSVKREAALRQPARLFEVVPGVVSTLHRGLHMLGKEPAETKSFFDALMRYHDPVLRLRRARSAMDAGTTGFAHLPVPPIEPPPFDSAPIPLEPPKPHTAEQPWLGRSERAAAGFEEDEAAAPPLTALARLEADFGDTQADEARAPEDDFAQTQSFQPTQGFQPTQPLEDEQEAAAHLLQSAAAAPVPVPAPTPAPALPPAAAPPPKSAGTPAHVIESEDEMQARTRATLARLCPGDWVDLRVRDVWRRAQLTWASDNGSLFMFSSRGGRLHGMTRRNCEKLIRARYLRLVDAGAVVDKALRSLAELAETAEQRGAH